MAFEPTDLVLFAARAAILVTAFGAFAWAFVSWRRAARKDTERLFEQLDIAVYEIRGLAESITHLTGRLDTLQEKVDANAKLASAGAAPSTRGYEVAIRLARTGANPDEVMATTGVTRQEAQLLARLHGPAASGHTRNEPQRLRA